MSLNIEMNKNDLLEIYQKIYSNHHGIKNSSSRDRIKKLRYRLIGKSDNFS